MDRTDPTRELTASRRIAAPRATVWRAFTDPAVLATWWGPDGFTNTFAAWEPRVGGVWRLTMHGPDGRDYANESRFAVLDPPERWAIDHITPPLFRLTATLRERDGGTDVHWLQAFASADDCARLRAICEPANDQNLARLAAAAARLR